MDTFKSKAIERELKDAKFEEWQIIKLINNGKSAAVFEARCEGRTAAIKIFDTDLIERFGREVQLARIQRELELAKNPHENVIDILGGGWNPDRNLYYIIMKLMSAETLEAQRENIPADHLPAITEQLAEAAKHLEDHGFTHRDIKPSNIAYDIATKRLTLLDLGVLGPIGEVGAITDVAGRPFIGTLQYSSPEYLLREEHDSIDGWRALSFYQIGAVLHDLIMKKPIFQEFSEPYARLVNAVQTEQPVIQSSTVAPYLIELARLCLLKKPEARLSLVNWGRFQASNLEIQLSAKERFTNRVIAAKAETNLGVKVVDETIERRMLEHTTYQLIKIYVRSIRSDNTLLPPVTVFSDPATGAVDIKFIESSSHGLPDGLVIRIQCTIIDASEQALELTGSAISANGTPSFQTRFFSGLLDRTAIYKGLENYIYDALDKSVA